MIILLYLIVVLLYFRIRDIEARTQLKDMTITYTNVPQEEIAKSIKAIMD
jgi:hypothetical protein